jgi:hypothetical protein
MKSDRFDMLERFAPLFEAPEPSFEGFLRRRDRKRRNQRLTAGVVAIAIFVAPVAWIAATGGWSGRAQTPVGPGPTVAPNVTHEIGLVGLAPVGATPSSPRRGELVLSFMFGHTMGDMGRFSVLVYEDGRLIWQRLGGGEDDLATGYTTGYLEQRLTQEGVELVRAEVISTGLFDHDLRLESGQGLNFGGIDVYEEGRLVRVTWGDCCESGSRDLAKATPTSEQASALQRLDSRLADPVSWLPASAWKDQEITAYVPSGYQVFFEGKEGTGLSGLMSLLPRPAEDLLRTNDIRRDEYTNLLGSHVYWYADLTTDEARALARILDDSGQERHESVFGLLYEFVGQRDYEPGQRDDDEIVLSIGPLLPHE